MDRYKRRGPIFQAGAEYTRELRAHRRSITRRQSRQDIFDSTRHLDGFNGELLESVVENEEKGPNNIKNSNKGSLARNERLKRWKEEKELKKKLEAQKKSAKPAFKVCKVNYEKPSYLASSSIPTKEQIPSDKRLTRAATRALAAPTMTLRSSKARINSAASDNAFKKPMEPGFKRAAKAVIGPRTSKQSKKVTKAETDPSVDDSFAPKDYKFVPVEGVSNYILVPPLSPKSADSFLIPNITVNKNVEAKIEAPIDERKIISNSKAGASSEVSEVMTSLDVVPMEVEIEAKTSVKTPSSTGRKRVKISPLIDISPFINRERRSLRRNSSKSHIPLDLEDDLELLTEKTTMEMIITNKPNVKQFRDLLRTIGQRLTSLCNDWNLVLKDETSICDSVVGRIRCAIGKANLLMAERFEQFSGLVDDCELVRGDKITTCEDLQGFWDMINIQVEEVIERFAKLDRIRRNGFQDEETPIKKAASKLKKIKLQQKVKPNKTDNEDRSRAARQRLADFKAKAAAKMRRRTEEMNIDKLAQFSISSPTPPSTQILKTPSKTPRRSYSSPSSSPSTTSRSSGRRRSLRHSILQKNFLDSSLSLENNKNENSKLDSVFSPLSSVPLSQALKAVNLSPFEGNSSPKRRFSEVCDPIDKENHNDSLSKYLEPSTLDFPI